LAIFDVLMRVGQSKPDYFFSPRKSSSIDLHIIHDITVIIPALRQADVTTSHSTRLSKNDSQVAGYQGERLPYGII
jgi:hypothetical protein